MIFLYLRTENDDDVESRIWLECFEGAGEKVVRETRVGEWSGT